MQIASMTTRWVSKRGLHPHCLDYMHCISLAVMRRFLRLWTKVPLTYLLGHQTKDLISSALLSLSSFMPREFARKPRSLKDRWKATEFRFFLVYTGPVVLYNKIPTELSSNIMLLSIGIHMLLNRNLCEHYAVYAHQLLVSFVQYYSQLFGTNQVVYNVHTLVHLADCVRNHGSLDKYKDFPLPTGNVLSKPAKIRKGLIGYIHSMNKSSKDFASTERKLKTLAENSSVCEPNTISFDTLKHFIQHRLSRQRKRMLPGIGTQ